MQNSHEVNEDKIIRKDQESIFEDKKKNELIYNSAFRGLSSYQQIK